MTSGFLGGIAAVLTCWPRTIAATVRAELLALVRSLVRFETEGFIALACLDAFISLSDYVELLHSYGILTLLYRTDEFFPKLKSPSHERKGGVWVCWPFY